MVKDLFSAIEFAVRAHAGQFRKGTKIPYIVHPLGVAKTLIQHGCKEEVVIAGVLHDTVEDTSVKYPEIEEQFGKEVAALVRGASEPDKSDTWENRKRHTVEKIKTAPVDLLLLSCADKLDNIRAIKGDYARLGEGVWSRFERPGESQRWYYQALAGAFATRMQGGTEELLIREFIGEVETVFGSQ